LRGGGATRRPRSKRHSLSLSVTGSSKSWAADGSWTTRWEGSKTLWFRWGLRNKP
jgi:hypothetical protein